MDKTQMYIVIVAGAIVIFLALIFVGIIPGLPGEETKPASITVWGFQDPDTWQDIFERYEQVRPNVTITYVKKNIDSFENDFINTLAQLQIPDVVTFPAEYFQKQNDKLAYAPRGFITERDITEKHIDATRFLWSSELQTVIGVPLFADVLVLYSNNSLLAKHFVTAPPKTWDEFLEISQKITQKDRSGNIEIAGSAMGRSRNILNAPDILTALFLQFGDQMIDDNGHLYLGRSVVREGLRINVAESALQFFVDFANPKKTSYAWSFSLPEAQAMFINGKLGFYIGFMSEYSVIRAKNPHLDIAVSLLPQLTGATRPTVYGKYNFLAVPKFSNNQVHAWDFIRFVNTPSILQIFADAEHTVAVRKDMISIYRPEAVRSVFAESVFALKLWKNPDPPVVNEAFRAMIENVAFGRKTASEAILDTNRTVNTTINPEQ